MSDTTTTILVFLALSSLMAATVAIGWLVRVSKHLSELATRVPEAEDIGKIIETADKMVSFKSRMAGCENRTEQSENRLSENETKVNGLAAKLEAAVHTAVDLMLDEHAAGLAEAEASMKVLTDKIQSLEEFQTATEKTRNLILAAFNDMGASIPPEECLGTRVDGLPFCYSEKILKIPPYAPPVTQLTSENPG